MIPAAIPFPHVSPEIFAFGLGGFTFALRWYALAYIAGILIGWRIMTRLARRPDLWPGAKAPFTAAEVEEFLTWAILGIIIGGRLGFVIFYQPDRFLAHPGEIPILWHGGMSFHGGFLGVVVAAIGFARRRRIALSALSDALAVAVPTGLMLGRIANFINAELWGRPTTLPWGVVFPGEAATCPGVLGACARHPSQLYEAALEGLVLGVALLWLVWRRGWLKRPWQTAGTFFAGYGLARFVVEFFRLADEQFITPDNPHGHVLIGMTMGQLLSLPMLVTGLAVVWWARRRA
jgi:phosphatidylglycerol:prolipoprotein diacylglycerol transferase